MIQRDDFRVKNKTHTDEYNKLELKIKQLRSDIRKEERRYVDKAQLIGTTISRATVDPMFEQRQFDLVMFDEVSIRCYYSYTFNLIFLCRHCCTKRYHCT